MSYALKSEEHSQQMQLVQREELEDEEDLFEAIDKLITHGINAGDVKKLQDAGIYTCNGLLMHTKKSLTGIKGLSEAKVDKICEAVEKIVVSSEAGAEAQGIQEIISLSTKSSTNRISDTLAKAVHFCVKEPVPAQFKGSYREQKWVVMVSLSRPAGILQLP